MLYIISDSVNQFLTVICHFKEYSPWHFKVLWHVKKHDGSLFSSWKRTQTFERKFAMTVCKCFLFTPCLDQQVYFRVTFLLFHSHIKCPTRKSDKWPFFPGKFWTAPLNLPVQQWEHAGKSQVSIVSLYLLNYLLFYCVCYSYVK